MHTWSRWYYGITHLEIYKGGFAGGGSDVATLERFEDGSCSLWIYNTHDRNLWTESPNNTTQHASFEEAMTAAETRFGVKAKRPDHGLPEDHPCNPKY